MKILTYSYFPLRADHWAGGAQTFLGELIEELAHRGIEFRVVCPKVDKGESLINVPNIRHLPVLEESTERHLTFDVRDKNLSFFREQLDWADLVWTIDEPFPLRISKPIVCSLGTLDGFEENEAVYSFNWDAIVAASTFVAECVETVAGGDMWDGSLAPPIHTVHNGINLTHFSYQDPAPLFERLRLSKDKQYLAFPHRPEAAKGFERALEIMKELKKRDGNYTLLVPTSPRCVGSVADRQKDFYQALRARIAVEGLAEDVILHEWISPRDMPAYLSLARWCLVTTLLPEGFCYAVVQAVACGTPVMTSQCGAIRQRFGREHGVFYSDDKSVSAIADIIAQKPAVADLQRGRVYAEREYGIDLCATRYVQVFRNTVPTRARLRSGKLNRIKVAPWWHKLVDLPSGLTRIWHDIGMRSMDLPPQMMSILHYLQEGGPLPADKITPAALDYLLENTLLVRCW